MAQSGSQTSGAGCFGWLIAAIVGFAIIGQCSSKQSPPGLDAATPAGGAQRYVDARSLNCRLSASSTATPLKALARGTSVTVLEEMNDWSKLEGSPPCWVSSAFLSSSPSTGGTASIGTAATAAATGASAANYFASQPRRTKATRPARAKSWKARSSTTRKSRSYGSGGCPCSGSRVCIGPRGGRYCITSGGNKRYGV